MSEDFELQRKIAELSGRINLHKQTEQSVPFESQSHTGHSWPANRGSYQGFPRGRGGRYSQGGHHKNRSLVLNASPKPSEPSTPGNTGSDGYETPTNESTTGPTFVSKRDRNTMQLINTAVYEQKTQEKTKAIEETLRQRQRLRDEKQKARLLRHFGGITKPYRAPSDVVQPPQLQSSAREIEVNGVRFRLADDGSKLIRITGRSDLSRLWNPRAYCVGGPNDAMTTPKHVRIAGVNFIRSRHGNLYRTGLVKARSANSVKKINELCPRFTPTGTLGPFQRSVVYMEQMGLSGTCPQGPLCPYIHDANKVAMCPKFLKTGSCPAGDMCDLSHDPNPHRVPACVHFLKGNCNNANCRYAHVRVNPGAPVCRDFGRLGYCEKGAECTDRHVHECPDYANKGFCRIKQCRLPHIDRAGQLRKQTAARNSDSPEDKTMLDVSSNEEDLDDIDADDIDSEDEETFIRPSSASHELTQQQDFVRFE